MKNQLFVVEKVNRRIFERIVKKKCENLFIRRSQNKFKRKRCRKFYKIDIILTNYRTFEIEQNIKIRIVENI